jgi:hypothetical protein
MKRWMLAAALFGALLVTASSAWSQVNLLGLEQAPPEQVGVSKEKLGRTRKQAHDANSSSSAVASFRSRVSSRSVNQP